MPKVYDCFMFFNELDLLEIRFNILDKHVDYFVLCESTQTFSGKEKPLYFEQNKERFDKWKDKIIHIVIGDYKTDDVFERTAWQKDSIRQALRDCNPDDIIYYGDVDEIWKPQTIGDKIYKLEQTNYSYYLNMRSSEVWQGTNVCTYKNLINLNDLRANHDIIIKDAGWHFTNQGGLEQIRKKLQSYDHQEMISPATYEKLEDRFTNLQDYLGRSFDWQGKPFHFWIDESDLPIYILDNKEKWEHLLKR